MQVFYKFLRVTACNAIARIGYGNSVRLSVCLSVAIRYPSKPGWERDFWFPRRRR